MRKQTLVVLTQLWVILFGNVTNLWRLKLKDNTAVLYALVLPF